MMQGRKFRFDMGLREEIAKVRQARGRLEITRAKLDRLDAERARIEQQRELGEQSANDSAEQERRGRRSRFELG